MSDSTSIVDSVIFVDKDWNGYLLGLTDTCLLWQLLSICFSRLQDLDEFELGGTVEWSPAGDASASACSLGVTACL